MIGSNSFGAHIIQLNIDIGTATVETTSDIITVVSECEMSVRMRNKKSK